MLGPLNARVGPASVVPSAPKPRQVLALLALNRGNPVGVSALVDELWGDRPPRSAEATLHTYVKQLRRMIGSALGPDHVLGPKDVLRRVPVGYRLDAPPDAMDVSRFERLASAGRAALEAGADAEGSELLVSALRLWRGPALADVSPGPVLRAEVLRLEELRLTALEERFGAELRLGRHRALLGELTALASRYPLHESLHAQLMIALHRSGRSWQSLELFRCLRRVLSDELGLEPSVRVRQLHEAILRGDTSLDAIRDHSDGGVERRRAGAPRPGIGVARRRDGGPRGDAMTTTEYLARAPRPHAPVRLLCFPFAGGGASAYARWQPELDARGASVDVLPVRLPGREGRSGEPRFTELTSLVEELDEELDEVLASPHLLYGHSMGALIAYALIRRRQERGAPLPRAALLAAYRAPHLPPPRMGSDANAGSGAGSGAESGVDFDFDLARALVALGGLPEALLGHPEWLRALLPVVRDDLALCASAGSAGGPVRVPLHLFAGADDSLVRASEVTAWRRHAARGCEVRVLPGGHFFLRTHEGSLLDEVAPLVRRYGGRRTVHAAAS